MAAEDTRIEADRSADAVRLAMQTREQAGAATDGLVIIPIGATEQHGPHLPLGTDHLIVDALAIRAAIDLSAEIPTLVAPTIPFGFSEHHFALGTTISNSVEVLLVYICEVAASLVRSGFRRIFILNGHGGNTEIISLASRRISLEHGVLVGAGSYWEMASNALDEDPIVKTIRGPGHAGAFETSLIQALFPDTIGTVPGANDVIAEPTNSGARYRTDVPELWTAGRGYTDDPRSGSAATGRRILDIVCNELVRSLSDFCKQDDLSADHRVAPRQGSGD